jgi:hypothetical protein
MTTSMARLSKLFLLILILWLPSPVRAQDVTVGPVVASNKLAWTMDAMDAQTAQTVVTYLPFVDGKPAGTAPLPAGSVTCTGTVAPVSCTATPIPSAVVDALNQIGRHDLTLAAVHPQGGQSSPSIPFSLLRPTPVPTGVKLTR